MNADPDALKAEEASPDLAQPLAPPPLSHPPTHHHHQQQQQLQGDSHAGPSSLHASTSQPSNSSQDVAAPYDSPSHLPNAGTEAEEERLFLQGDFLPNSRRRRRKSHLTEKPSGSRSTSKRPREKKARDTGRIHQRAKGVRERVLHFTPSWFSVVMGTGAIAVLINLLPWPSIHAGLRWPALVFWILACVLFIIFSVGLIARYIMYPEILPLTIKHPQKSMFWGTVPMGLTVLVTSIAQLGTVEFSLGYGPALAASGLWWLACAMSLLTAIGIPFVVTTYQSHSFSSTTAALMIPLVPPITAAASGSVIAEALMDKYPTYAFTIVIFSYMVLGVGLPLALLVLVLYFQRLVLFKQPPREVIISVFLPLGPCGQGGEAILHLGIVAYKLFPTISAGANSGVPELTLPVGQALFGVGIVGALMLWSLGIWWAFIAVFTLIRETRRGRLSFNMGFWSGIFPMASQSIVTARLALTLDSLTLKIVFTAFVLVTLGAWFCVAIPTAIGFADGSLLSRKAAPCIADIPIDPLSRGKEDVEEDEWESDGEADVAESQQVHPVGPQ